MGAAGLILSSCAPKVIISSAPLPTDPAPPPGQAPQVETRAESPKQTSPRLLASLRLTEEGRILIRDGRPDDAIRALERAISLDATNGQNYYYLAEAWLLKDNIGQAGESNRLAGIYLKEDPHWLNRVREQRARIKNRSR